MPEIALEGPTADSLVAHWRWRPDWTPGRVCLWWYLTFEDHPAVGNLASSIAQQLDSVPAVDVVPRDCLHLTVAELGYADDLPDDLVTSAATQARDSLAPFGEFSLRLGPVAVLPGAIALEARPPRTIAALRGRLPHRTPLPDDEGVPWPGPTQVPPHVSVAYLNSPCGRDEVTSRLTTAPRPVFVTVRRLVLAAVVRRESHYEWTDLHSIALSSPTSVSSHPHDGQES